MVAYFFSCIFVISRVFVQIARKSSSKTLAENVFHSKPKILVV